MAAQLKDLRLLLRSAAHSEDGASLFKWLYRSWCHSLGAVLSLCFLSEVVCHLHAFTTLHAVAHPSVRTVAHADAFRARDISLCSIYFSKHAAHGNPGLQRSQSEETRRGVQCPQAYGHAYELASCYAELPMGVEVLVQIDRLVQLLETPVFNFLRLHLLHPARFPALLWCRPALLASLWTPSHGYCTAYNMRPCRCITVACCEYVCSLRKEVLSNQQEQQERCMMAASTMAPLNLGLTCLPHHRVVLQDISSQVCTAAACVCAAAAGACMRC